MIFYHLASFTEDVGGQVGEMLVDENVFTFKTGSNLVHLVTKLLIVEGYEKWTLNVLLTLLHSESKRYVGWSELESQG